MTGPSEEVVAAAREDARRRAEAAGRTFRDTEVVNLDYQTFSELYFFKCKLIYAGGRPPVMLDCTFDATEFIFDGPALNTVHFLQGLTMIGGGGRTLVEHIVGLTAQAELNYGE